MGEVEIKRGVAFMNNPRLASWSYSQKVEFLRGKMSPADLEEVLRRTNVGKQTDDLTQFFEMDTTQRTPTATAPRVEVVSLETKKTGYGAYALAAAGLIGAVTSALFFSAPNDTKRPKPKPEEIPLSRHNTEPVHFSPLEEAKAPPVEEVKEKQRRLESALASIEAKMKTLEDVPAKPPPVSSPAPDFYSLRRAIAGFLTACSQELKGKVLGSLITWLKSIEGNPANASTARINITTPKFKNEVATVQGAETLMMALGFTLNDNYWEFNEAKIDSLREGLRILIDENTRLRTSTKTDCEEKGESSLLSSPFAPHSALEDSKADS